MLRADLKENQSRAKLVSISSGKGGVGKTFFTVHLAARAASQGLQVLLLDSDFGLANVDVMLGLTPQGTIYEVLHGNKSINDVLVHTEYGFDVIPGGSSLAELAHLNGDQQRIILESLNHVLLDYDLAILDNAAGIGENVLYFSSLTEEPVVILTPEPTSLTDAYALIKVLSTRRYIKRFKVVVNKASEAQGLMAFKRLDSVADRYLNVYLEYLGNIENSDEIPMQIQKQRLVESFIHSNPHAPKVFDRLIECIKEASDAAMLTPYWQRALGEEMQ